METTDSSSTENSVNKTGHIIELFNYDNDQAKQITLSVSINNHEIEGWRFKTKGARINAQVSGMAVSMKMGLRAYLIERINEKTFKASNRSDLIPIFAYDANISKNDTAIAQQVFHEFMWRGTIESARKRGVDEYLLNYVMGK